MENPESTHSVKPARFPTVRRLFSRKMLYAVLALITLLALFYAEENFRGARAWENYRQDAEARGVKLDYAAYIPPPVPDAENGANTPFIQSWFLRPKGDDTNAWAELRRQETNRWPAKYYSASGKITIKRRTTGGGSQDDRFLTDLVAWEQAFARLKEPQVKDAKPIVRNSHGTNLDAPEQAKAAVAVLEELKAYEPAIAELRAMSARSKIRYPVNYKLDEPFSTTLPHLAKMKGIVQTLSLQACAELAAGQTERAFQDVRLMLWLGDSLIDDPVLIGLLVRIACQQIATQPIWEGLGRHQWSEEQLKEFQERLLRVNYAQSAQRSMDGERAGALTFIQWVRKQKNLGDTMASMFASEEDSPITPANQAAFNVAGRFVPRGWFYFETANFGQLMDVQFRNAWDSESKVFHPQSNIENDKRLQELFGRDWELGVLHHQWFARLLLPALGRTAWKSARAQSTAHQAALACALERFYLAEGKYPAALTELVPKYLAKVPHEVVSSEPMRYRAESGGYVLWSAGWDGVDEGGIFLRPAKDGQPEHGDWVWRSAP